MKTLGKALCVIWEILTELGGVAIVAGVVFLAYHWIRLVGGAVVGGVQYIMELL